MTVPPDGLFYKKGAKEPFRFTWGEKGKCYRLEPVTTTPGAFEVPPLDTVKCEDSLFEQDLLPRELILVGERGGGLTYFLDWLTQGGSDQWQQYGPIKAAEYLQSDVKNGNKYLAIDTTRPNLHEEPEEQKAMARIAAILDSNEWKQSGNRVVCLTRDVHCLEKGQTAYSVILSRGHAYRLPHFLPIELEKWLKELVSPGKQKSTLWNKLLDEETVKKKAGEEQLTPKHLAYKIHRWIGGQPMLTHFLLRRVADAWESDQPKSPQDLKALIQQAGMYLRDHRPHLVKRWGTELKELLKDPVAKRRFESYAAGVTKPPKDDFDRIDVDLYLAGWVGWIWGNDGQARWGIRSACHEAWAREILQGGRS